MNTIHNILEKYWGYKQFRPLQEDIINAVLAGNDTLALLPTGGGKSICFQVPAMFKDGICIVISPLIALMKDQVENLQRKGIAAVAITSSMHKREIDIALDNCVHGKIKFLYLSPERLETELVKVRLQRMNVNLIAIDESHCISQWGYDFRPSYLKIATLRDTLPNIPILALTATATKGVVKDIQEKLHFKKPNVLQKSFERTNLAYIVIEEEDKLARLVKIANKLKGTGIVYVRNRKKTHEIAQYLKSNNIAADFYHAGIDAKTRDQKQNNWMTNKTRIIVCTNAFGMGIDKPDVRFVVHIDLPDTLEAYFQEAGRAGRDEQKAYAILLYNKNDTIELENNINNQFPSIDEIKQSYQALANFYQLPTGSGLGTTYNFDIVALCDTYKLNALTVFNSLKFLEKEGYLTTSEAVFQPSRIKLELNREDLYKFQIASPAFDSFIKLLLRNYSGLFDNFTKINEFDIAKKTGFKREEIVKKLTYLNQQQVLIYLPQTELPQLTFTQERVDAKHLSLSKENYLLLKQRALERMEAVIHYADSKHKCRNQLLLGYFDEKNANRCNQCDVCIEENKKILHNDEFEKISQQIKEIIAIHPMALNTLVNSLTEGNEEKRLKTIQWLIDNEQIQYNSENLLHLI
ncbi:MAG: ATP-dependent DNA helicase RecQ [Bacteroidia bacterium]